MIINLEALAMFLVKAKKATYAGDGRTVQPERVGFKELRFTEGNWDYRDSYAGYFFAPGQEIVRFQDIPVWSMAYSGGMHTPYHGDEAFASQTFTFLKKALSRVETSRPFRGPTSYKEGKWDYYDESVGNVTQFHGTERICFEGREVYRQNYIGGLIVPKEQHGGIVL
jgi:hypothetical protein